MQCSRASLDLTAALLQPLPCSCCIVLTSQVWYEPGVSSLLTFKTLASLGPAIWQSMFAVVLQRHYGLPVRTNGFVLSFMGCVSILCKSRAAISLVCGSHGLRWLAIFQGVIETVWTSSEPFGAFLCSV